MSKEPAYFMYFPGNYRWSAAFINIMGSIAYGGAEIGELHRIGRRLKDKAADDDAAWFDACVEVADGVRNYAERWDKSGHRFAAAHAYLRACNYYQMGERFRTPKDKAALDAYRRGVDCFHRHAALTDLRIEVVEVPFVDGSLPGYLVHAQNAQSARPPCVVFFDGLDVTKEIQFVRGVPDLVKRGISVLVMDGPGTGEAIRFRGHYLRHDYEVAGSACVDYLEKRADVDPKRIGIVAISLGGYYSPRCAAMEPRYAACIAWGAQWDYHATWKKRIDAQFKASLSVPGHHIMWILGVDTLDAALKKLEPFKLDGVMQKMRCPFLLVHGADDEQIPLADAQK
ncbi:MAG TPA: alpha/beta hydrolase, partial [Burkholderiales bacterium]|nr:alpha/beta hydrolase [Burkholderiales bacterium]